jgi:hypothetical protein
MLSGDAVEHDNIAGALEGVYVDPAAGDLRLSAAGARAAGAARPTAHVTDDFFGSPRPERPTPGAIEMCAPPRGGE